MGGEGFGLVTGGAGAVGHRNEALLMAGAAIVRQAGMGGGQRPARPDDIGLDAGFGGDRLRRRQERSHQKGEQDESRQPPRHHALARQRALQRKNAGFRRHVGGIGGNDPFGGDRDGVGGVAGRNRQAVAGDIDGGSVGDDKIGAVDELPGDFERDSAGRLHRDHPARQLRQPGVALHDTQIGELDIAIGTAADADFERIDAARAGDVPAIGTLRQLANDEPHAATSR